MLFRRKKMVKQMEIRTITITRAPSCGPGRVLLACSGMLSTGREQMGAMALRRRWMLVLRYSHVPVPWA